MDLKTVLKVISAADLSEIPEEGFEVYQFAQWYRNAGNCTGVLSAIEFLGTFPSEQLDQLYAQFLLEREEK